MLSQLTIAEAHKKLSSKEITSEELVTSCIERIESVDDSLNAVVHREFDRALEEAKKVDSKGSFDSPLMGIPFLTKDIYCEEGVRTTGSSNILRDKDYVPPFESTTTDRLKQKGAISIGKVNTDEFAQGASTEHSCYGVTKNPWDTTRVPGGTSGGSAAAVAADECIFSLGTDTGGSIRQPSALCGVTGLRPTYGRTSRFGTMSMTSSLDTTCALTKSVEDVALVLEAIAGRDSKDVTTGDKPVAAYSQTLTGDMKGMTVGLPKEYFIDGIDPEIEAAVREGAKVMESLGATVKEISLPHTKYALATYYIICPSEVSSNMARYDGIRYGIDVSDSDHLVDHYFKARSRGFGDEVKRRIMIGTFALSVGYYDAYYRQAQKVRTLVQKDFFDAFESVDLILCPTTPTPAFKIGEHTDDPVAMYLEDIFTVPHALAGIPSISVPCGLSSEGLPIGLQLAGPQWEEARVLQAADAYQKATEWHRKKPVL